MLGGEIIRGWVFWALIYLYIMGLDYFSESGIIMFVEGHLHTSPDP
jgi:hypothetical protein